MRFFISTIALVTIIGVVTAGHFHHGQHGFGSGGGGGHSETVSYSVATKHEHGGHGGGYGGGHDGGYGGGHGGGHDAGHHTVHEWGQGGGHDGDHYGGDDGGHGAGHYGGHDSGHDDGHDQHAYPKYDFDYGVKDSKTGDIKGHSESRDGHKVKGSYTLKEADGTTRHVEYSADKKNGFTAVVHKIGVPNADHGSHGGHGHGYHDGGHHGHGEASSFVVVKKHEEHKH